MRTDQHNDDDTAHDEDASESVQQSKWRTVRPWSNRFVLTIREITSVSATFILSSILSSDSDPSLASLGLSNAPGDDDALEDILFISEALGKGLSVYVNGAPWKRTLIRVDEENDEAIIILYGLIPGRQYDVVIGIMTSQGEEMVQSQMLTQSQSSDADSSRSPERIDNPDTETSPIPIARNGSSSVSTTPDDSPANTPPRPLTIEDRAVQLRHQLQILSTERNSLVTQLKAARKEAQKSDAALRAEIEVLKRAAEKHAPVEHRSRQKVLALQEAVKQTAIATTDTEQLVHELEMGIPDLKGQEAQAQKKHSEMEAEAEKRRRGCEESVKADQKKILDLRNELSGLSNKLEKLSSKKDKFETDVLPGLEGQLSKLVQDIELVEHDAIHAGLEEADPGLPMEVTDHRPPRGGFSMPAYRRFHPPAPIGSQRPLHHSNSYKQRSNSTTQSFVGRPHETQLPSFQGVTSSNLSSNAAPFDPSARLAQRLGAAMTNPNANHSDSGLSSTGSFPSSSSSSSPSTSNFQLQNPNYQGQTGLYRAVPSPPLSSNHQSTVKTKGDSNSSLDLTAAATVRLNNTVPRPVSPLRQATLPSVSLHPQGSHNRRSTVDGAL